MFVLLFNWTTIEMCKHNLIVDFFFFLITFSIKKFKTFFKWILGKTLLSGFLLEKEEVQLLQDFPNPPVSKNYTTETFYWRKLFILFLFFHLHNGNYISKILQNSTFLTT